MDFAKQGKRNKAMGADFERRVRKDLENKGWIVSKWQNNVVFNIEFQGDATTVIPDEVAVGYCVPAKPGYYRMMQTGFPDFLAYTNRFYKGEIIENGGFEIPLVASDGKTPMNEPQERYAVIFIECKTNGYLSKEEKEKAQWYLDNNYCSKFLIAYKTKEKNKVKVNYKELE